MQQYMIHLNGGYNPFVRLGRGALGYRPNRKMIGRGDNNTGGSEGEPPSNINPLTLPDRYLSHGTLIDPDYFRELLQRSREGEERRLMSNADEEARLYDVDVNEEPKEETKEDVVPNDMFTPVQKIIIGRQKDEEIKANNKINEAYYINKRGGKQPTPSEIQQKIASKYKSVINSALEKMNDLKNHDDILSVKLTSEYIRMIDNWMELLNGLYTKKQFTINHVTLKVDEVSSVKESKLNFPLNIKTKTEADSILNEYWKKNNNTETKLTTSEDYDEDINNIIKSINEASIFDNFIDKSSTMYIQAENFRDSFPDKTLSEKYAKTIKIDGMSKFFNSDGTQKTVSKDGETYDLFDYEYYSPGKAEEFSICGKNNPLAKQLYNITSPNLQVSDFIVEDILKSGAGKYFCADNIDFDNKMIIEMKKYVGYNYATFYDLNIKLKKVYYDKLIVKIDAYIDKYYDEQDETHKDNLMDIINIYHRTLTNKDEFDKDFYKNEPYIGIGVTMNKFNTIVIPSNYNYNDSPSTKEMMLHVQKSQGQKFIPKFEDRKVTKIECTPNGSVGYEKFNTEFNTLLNGTVTPYDFKITCAFSKTICVYDYTNDNLVQNDFILGTYKCAYAHDDRDNIKYNAVLIPIEKFLIKK